MALRLSSLFFFLFIFDAQLTLADPPSLPSLPPPPPVKIDLPALPAAPSAEDGALTPEAAQDMEPLTDITDVTDITETDINAKPTASSKLSPAYSIPMPPMLAFIGNTLAHRYLPQKLALSKSPESPNLIPIEALEKITPPSSPSAESIALPPMPTEAEEVPVAASTAPLETPSLPLPENSDISPAEVDAVPVKLSPPPLPTPAPLVGTTNADEEKEEKNVKIIAPLANPEIDNIDNIDHYIDDDSEDISKDEPFSVYNQDDVIDPSISKRKAAHRESKKMIEIARKNDLLAQIVADIRDADETAAETLLSLGNLGPATREEAAQRTIKERIAKRKDEIKKLQERAALNYKTSLPPASIYNDRYSAQNKHLPKPSYLSQYRQYTFNAIDDNDISALRTFLKIGKFLEARDADGNTPLIYATEKNKPTIIQYLLARGANVHAQNTDKATSLHIAAYTGQQEITDLLLEAGARVNSQDSQGYTPLMLASMYRKDELAKMLLTRGANKSLRDKYGRTASSIAAEMGNMALASDLKLPEIAPRSNPSNYYKTIQSKEITAVKKKTTTKKTGKKRTKKKSSVKKATAKKSVKPKASSSL